MDDNKAAKTCTTTTGVSSDKNMGDKSRKNVGVGSFFCSWKFILEKDVTLTNKLAVCSSDDSVCGRLRPLMKALEYSCHGIPWLFGTLCAIFMTHKPDLHEKQINLLAALLIDLVVVTILKAAARRPRPQHNKMDMFVTVSVDKFSFPSGHCTRAGLLMCFLLAQFPMGCTLDCMVCTWAVVVSLSRVLLGRHHLLDVFCGFVIGMLEYKAILAYMWIPRDTCEGIISFIEEDFHL